MQKSSMYDIQLIYWVTVWIQCSIGNERNFAAANYNNESNWTNRVHSHLNWVFVCVSYLDSILSMVGINFHCLSTRNLFRIETIFDFGAILIYPRLFLLPPTMARLFKVQFCNIKLQKKCICISGVNSSRNWTNRFESDVDKMTNLYANKIDVGLPHETATTARQQSRTIQFIQYLRMRCDAYM